MIEVVLFGLVPELKQSPLLPTVTEPIVVAQPPPEPTLEEKIASNYYQCDESIEWIRADNAQCIPKRLEYRASESTIASEPISTRVSHQNKATAPAGWFPRHQCTWYVWTKRPVGLWNDASQWLSQARRDGWATGTTPQVGAIGVQKSGNHVVYIERVDGDQVYISERNYDRRGSYRETWMPANKYNYIY